MLPNAKFHPTTVSERSIDDELLARYRNGDFLGFDLFYRRNHAFIYNFLMSRLANRSDAEEAFQETFLHIHKSILSYDITQKAHSAADLSVAPKAERALIARQDLWEVMVHLTAEECVLLEERFLNESDFESIAARQKTTAANARQKLSRLLRKIRA